MTNIYLQFLDVNNNFAEWLKSARREARMTMEVLGEKVGVSKQYISVLERGEPHALTNKAVTPKKELVIAIAQTLNADENEALSLAGYASTERKFPPKMQEMLKNLSFHLEDKNLSQEEKDALFDEVEFAYYLALDRLEKRKKEKEAKK